MMLQLLLLLLLTACSSERDPLPSWNAGETKEALMRFIKESPKEGRIATFDQDGTLWVEKPVPVQLFYLVDRVQKLLKEQPELKEKNPYKNFDFTNPEAYLSLSIDELKRLIKDTETGMSVDTFHKEVKEWLKTARHPRFQKPFTSLVYQPMVELIHYLQAQGFAVYIVSGSGQEFIRSYADSTYGIPPAQVIGTLGKTAFRENELIKEPELLLIDNNEGKPEAINLFIGKKPTAAFGNSNGDKEMLEWATTLKLLVHHDDGEREYAYDSESKVGRLSKETLDEAKREGWLIVSIKRDWKELFPQE